MKRIFGLILVVIIVGTAAMIFLANRQVVSMINSFEDCAGAGYPVQGSQPRVCRTPDGGQFAEKTAIEPGGTTSAVVLAGAGSAAEDPYEGQDFVRLSSSGEVRSFLGSIEGMQDEAAKLSIPEGMVALAIIDGPKSTGGWGIEVTDTNIIGDSAVIQVAISKPGPGCMTAQAFTYPYQIILLEKSVKTIKVEKAINASTCR